ncbi:MAG: hypothetical protein HY013_02340 [Candidatus Solibacter usitatus]|nr:hypothetical protein [Candidatus Solibacter usitatus]
MILLFLLAAAGFHRDIAPILAYRCNRCHGTEWMGKAGGLSTFTYYDLMKGGSLGSPVVPGDPEGSLLVHFLDGRRGESHRMPLGEPPLAKEEIARIREWIAGGARPDEDRAGMVLTIPGFRVRPGRPLRISAEARGQAYFILTLRDPRGGAVLRQEGAVEGAWTLQPEPHWPKRITFELRIAYTDQTPEGARFRVAQGEVVRQARP